MHYIELSEEQLVAILLVEDMTILLKDITEISIS